DSLVHIAGADDEMQRVLTAFLAAAGIESRAYPHLRAFLSSDPAERPGCLVIDARPAAISGLESQAILLPLPVRCPIVVTACLADITMLDRGMTSGAIRVVAKPLREREVIEAVSAGIAFDCEQRLRASRQAELSARFAKLTPRERQVMALVSLGKLNK